MALSYILSSHYTRTDSVASQSIRHHRHNTSNHNPTQPISQLVSPFQFSKTTHHFYAKLLPSLPSHLPPLTPQPRSMHLPPNIKQGVVNLPLLFTS
jgi:hypothetical protein